MLRAQIAMAGYTEVLTLSLCSKAENYEMLGLENDGKAVVLANPKTIEFEVCRKNQKKAMFARLAVGLDLAYHTHYQLESSPFEKLAPQPYEAFIDQYTLWQYLASLKTMVTHNKYFI